MNGNRADAEDALSQAMLHACEQWPAHAERVSNPKAWLAQLTRNVCHDLHRKRQRSGRLLTRLEGTVQTIWTPASDGESEANEGGLVNDEENGEGKLLQRLPVILQQAFELRVLRQMPYDRIAHRLGISPANVRKRIQLARALLRQHFTVHDRSLNTFRLEGHEPCTRLGSGGLSVTRPPFRAEIVAQTARSQLVSVRLPSGIERDVHLFFEKSPTRQRQKMKTWRAYVRRHPRGWKKRLELADLLYAIGDWQEAVEGYTRVLEMRPWEIGVAQRLGNIWRLAEDWDEARAAYERGLATARKAASRRHLRGLLAACSQDFQGANAELQAAARLEPKNAAHWHVLAETCFQAGDFEAALAAIEQALTRHADDLVALSLGHLVLLAAGRTEEAWQKIDRVLQLAPQDAWALKRVAERRCQAGLVRDAEGKQTKQMIQRGLQQAPHAAGPHESSAIYFISRGHWRRGLAVLRNFVHHHAGSVDGWQQLARWLAKHGQTKAAAEALKVVHRLHPNQLSPVKPPSQ